MHPHQKRPNSATEDALPEWIEESRRAQGARQTSLWRGRAALQGRVGAPFISGFSPCGTHTSYPAWQNALEIPPQSRAGSSFGKNNPCNRRTDSSRWDSSTRNEIVRSEAPWQMTRTSISETAPNTLLATSGCRRMFSPTKQTSAL